MPPPLLFDLAQIETERVIYDHAFIYERLPHKYEFEFLDGICNLDRAAETAIAFVDCPPTAWWARGHVPGRPIMPGVLQIEAAAQLIAFISRYIDGCGSFIALGGVHECRFREPVVPPCRLYILCKLTENRPRRVTGSVQGVVNGKLAFEAVIQGLAMPDPK
jgi:3-hydroxyacyl-[acyl-carrier-protein] dehydratase